MKRSVTTHINEELCTGCGLCVEVCPAETLSMINGKAVVTGNRSLQCDHCAAICPEGAITVDAVDKDALDFTTITVGDDWIEYGAFDTASLVRLMRSRRSCRMFSNRSVPQDVLEDLVKIGVTAPSGTNSQLWTFSILPDRSAVEQLGAATGRFFRSVNKLAEKAFVRFLSRIFLRDALGRYYREHYESVKEALAEWDETGRDRLFHGAPAVIIIGMRPGASCPVEDALMASQNILLAAHAMGLGTCMIGYVVEAIKRDPRIKRLIGIPGKERIYAVIAVGYPKRSFARTAGRKKVVPRYFEVE